MLIKNEKNGAMTNGEFFENYCYKQDLCQIYRMWMEHLDRTIGRDATKEEKERVYDHWLRMPFSQTAWSNAQRKENIAWW